MEFLALRCSESLRKINYKDLCLVFDEDYILGESMHDDEEPFDSSNKDENDEAALKQLEDARRVMSDIHSPEAESPEKQGAEGEGEIASEDDLLLTLDEAVKKIV